MSPDVSASAVLLVGVMLVRLVLADVYQRYVRVGMGPWLLVAGVLLAALGVVTAVRAIRGPAPDDEEPAQDDDHDGHRHGGADRIGWLLLAPVLVLLLVAPPALGSFGVQRTSAVRVTTGAAEWAALPAGTTPRPMTLLEVDQRAWDRSGASLSGVTLRLTGFVSDASTARSTAVTAAGFGLARYQIACCAADAVASVVRVVGVTGPPPQQPTRDSWATVVGTYAGTLPDGTPQIAATSVEIVPAPVDPYE
jgi:uncharacterized repeat protein (TIGR03943 family)